MQEAVFGQTIGKKILQIKVVKDDLGKINYTTAFIRCVLGVIVDYSCLNIGLIIAADHPKNKRLGDIVAKTIVIKDNKQIP